MATEPLPAPDDIKNAPNIIKIPETPIMDRGGNMAREWIYFFNNISRAVDQQITANLPELTQKLIDSVADIIRLDEDAASTNLELAYAINDIADNRTDIATANTNISQNSQAITAINTTLTSQGTAISNLETSLQQLETTHSSDMQSINDQLQTLSDNYTELEGRVAALENAP